ncbi:MAG: FeoA family protein [Acidobacteria bacterium]|nr:FeoA family protein [Acidobacteriota bacterium]
MSRSSPAQRLASIEPGTRGHIVRVARDHRDRADRLMALGVTPGASIHVLQQFPSVVFMCDQTELAVEPAVADAILVQIE